MTLTEALNVLHEQGKIRAAWLPGMLGVRCSDPPELIRVVQLHAGRPTVWAVRDVEGAPIEWDVSTEADDGWPEDVEVVVSDEATVGCLLALLREVSGDPFAYVAHSKFLPSGIGWTALWMGSSAARATRGFSTEGLTLANALIALAGGTP